MLPAFGVSPEVGSEEVTAATCASSFVAAGESVASGMTVDFVVCKIAMWAVVLRSSG